MLVGAALVYRGTSGFSHLYHALGVRTAPSSATLPYEIGVHVRAAVTINQPRSTVYAFWRELENLPRFMKHLIDVEPLAEGRSRWMAEGPGGRRFTWDAEVISELQDEYIAWKSLPGSEVDSAGSVRFNEAPGGRGTEIRVRLQYNPPAGRFGAFLAKIMGREPQQEITADLRRLKQYLETGEEATTKGQPQGPSTSRRHSVGKMLEEALP